MVPTRGRSHLLLVPSGRARAWVLGVAAPPPFRVSGFGSRVSVRTAHLELERRGHIIYHPKPVCLSSAPSPSPTSQTALLAKPRILVNYIFPLLWLCGGRLANRRALVALVSRSRSHKKNTRAAASLLLLALSRFRFSLDYRLCCYCCYSAQRTASFLAIFVCSSLLVSFACSAAYYQLHVEDPRVDEEGALEAGEVSGLQPRHREQPRG